MQWPIITEQKGTNVTTSVDTFKTADQIQAEAKTAYEQAHPRPDLPPTPSFARPSVVHIGEAHAWVEVTTRSKGFTTGKARVEFFIVHRDGSTDQRIEGNLTPDEIEAFIQDLQRVKVELEVRQAFIDATTEYEKRNRQWEQARDEFARMRLREWELAQQERKKLQK